MDFGLTDEQRSLQTTVRDFLADRFGLARVREGYETGDGHPLDLWTSVGEQGWLAVLVPEEHDGLGLGLVDAQVVARAFGAGVVPGPWLGTVLAGEALRLAGSPAQQAAALPRLAAGELVGAVSLWADDVVAADGALTGAVQPVEYAAVAGLLVVAAREADGTGLYLLDPGAEGVTVTPLESYDGTVRVGRVSLAGAHGERLTGSSAAVVQQLLDRGAVLAAADLAGLAREALTRTVAYDKDRVQFGRPVGSFQALKHDLADLHVAVTMAEHACLYAAHALDVDLPDAAVAVSVAKSKASDVAKAVTGAMVQYHGGIGYTWEHEAHFFYKRAKRVGYSFGDAKAHRERLATLVIDRPSGPVDDMMMTPVTAPSTATA